MLWRFVPWAAFCLNEVGVNDFAVALKSPNWLESERYDGAEVFMFTSVDEYLSPGGRKGWGVGCVMRGCWLSI